MIQLPGQGLRSGRAVGGFINALLISLHRLSLLVAEHHIKASLGIGFCCILLTMITPAERSWLWIPAIAGLGVFTRKPILGLAAFVAFLPLERYVTAPLIGTFTSHEAILGLTILGWLLNSIFYYEAPRRIGLWRGTLPWLLALALSVLVYPGFTAGIKGALRWGEPVATFILGCELCTREGFRRYLLPSAWLVALATAASGLLQSLSASVDTLQFMVLSREGGSINLLFNQFVRAHATFIQANHFAAFLLLMSGPVLFYLWLRRKSTIATVISWTAVAVWIVALALTFSRGAWIAGIMTSGFILLLLRKTKLLVVGLVILVLTVGIVALKTDEAGSITRRLASLSRITQDETVSERLAIYTVGWTLFRWNPMIGIGVGRYRQEVAGLTILGLPDLAVKTHLHSLYLQMAVELGIVGIAAFAIWVLPVLAAVGSRLRKENTATDRIYLVVLLAPILAYLVHSTFDVFLYRGLHLLFGLWLGIAAGISAEIKAEHLPAQAP